MCVVRLAADEKEQRQSGVVSWWIVLVIISNRKGATADSWLAESECMILT